MLDSNSVAQLAQPIIEGIGNSVVPTGSSDPLANVDGSMDGVSMVATTPPQPQHPGPYNLLLAPSSSSPGQVDNIWQPLVNLTA